jgi:hypothetical protein
LQLPPTKRKAHCEVSRAGVGVGSGTEAFAGGTISVDGTRLKANASKHRGVNYQRSGQLIKQLEEDVKELLRKAERADSQGEMDPARLPEEIAKRQELKAKLEAARQQLEERHRQELAARSNQL